MVEKLQIVSDEVKPATAKCRVAEILQHTCEVVNDGPAVQPQIHCYPIPRIFRICPNRPAVEITRYVKIDPKTGEVEIPPESSQTLPKGLPWRDIAPKKDDPVTSKL